MAHMLNFMRNILLSIRRQLIFLAARITSRPYMRIEIGKKPSQFPDTAQFLLPLMKDFVDSILPTIQFLTMVC
jgi:hypothetical protein